MTEDIAVVKPSHGEFGDDHLEEGSEGGEDTELHLVETKASSCAEVATLHDCIAEISI